MSKYLHLKFKDGRLFSNPYTKDRILNGSVSESRTQSNLVYDDIFNYKLLSNVLRVLCGEAPKASFRETIFPEIKKYDEIAKNSFIHFGIEKDGQFYDLPKNDNGYFKEMKTLLKAYDKSFSIVKLNWEIVRRYLGDAYIPVLSLLNSYGIYSDNFYDFVTKAKLLSVNEKEGLYNTLKPYKKTALYNFIYDERYDAGHLTRSVDYIYLTNGRGIDDVTNLSGSILVPYNTDLNIMKTTCSIFDGGLVCIDKIDYVYEDQLDAYTKISDYSTKTKVLIKKTKDETED